MAASIKIFVCICIFAISLPISPIVSQPKAQNGAQKKEDETEQQIQHLTAQQLDSLLPKHKYILVYVYEPTTCSGCLQDLNTVLSIGTEAAETIPEFEDVQVFASFLPDEMSKYGLKDSPALLFFREGFPIIYEDVSPTSRLQSQDVIMWLLTAKSPVTVVLNDDNFEHDTQALSGATTGDWFVLFYDNTCNKLLPRWESLAIRLKGRKPVARVNTATSPKLVKRFNIEKCPEMILFRKSRMYYYELPKDDTKSFEAFAISAFANARADAVPAEPTPFDNLVADAARFVKKHPVIFGVTAGTLFFILLMILILTSTPRPHQHED